MNFDPELLNDFLTESGELLEQLDGELVTLESTPQDPDLLNKIFRALHTIKGSASFMTLTNLVSIAHAAEGTLNAARNRQLIVDRPCMDMLLAAVDTIKTQFEDMRNGRDLTAPDAQLVATLTALGEGKGAAAHASAHTSEPPAAAGGQALVAHAEIHASALAPTSSPRTLVSSPPAFAGGSVGAFDLGDATFSPLNLPPGKTDLLEFLVADLDTSLQTVEQQVANLRQQTTRDTASASLSDLGEALRRSVDFFECDSMVRLASLIEALAHAAPGLEEAALQQAVEHAGEALNCLKDQSKALASKQVLSRPVEAFCKAFDDLIAGKPAVPAATSPAVAEVEAPAQNVEAAAPVTSAPASAGGSVNAEQAKDKGESVPATAAEQTIRVEVGRLESLLNLVGELVLQKNRVAAVSRQLSNTSSLAQELRESVSTAVGGLDRVTSDLQVAVMRTRMQPLDKLFGKYPRLIRDLARKLNKQIELVIEGGETEVDKSVLEELGDPLVHLMRNSADHGVESPADRKAAGKPELGTITLSAAHQGSHVQIQIRDNGKGLDKERISRKAIEKGLYTEAQIAAMSENDIYRIIFAAGFSTAEKLSDVSGRGVGMDVVRTNIEKLKGTIELASVPGQGTTLTIHIPLTVAILTAMMVGVGPEIYAIPLGSILEIVKPTKEQLATIRRAPVMRLRDTVLPLLDAGDLFSQPSAMRDGASPFAVVIAQQERRVGLLVSRLIGQQEVVIKPLDDLVDRDGPVSGATVRDDGGVSLIVDVPRLIAIAQQQPQSKAAVSV